MPVSKHRKKGQAKAVRKPGPHAAPAEPLWAAKERRILKAAHRKLRTDSMDDDEYEVMTLALDLVLDEVLTISEDGTDVIARNGSRQAVVDAYCLPEDGADPVDDPALTAEIGQALLRLEACGLVRLEGDELVPVLLGG